MHSSVLTGAVSLPGHMSASGSRGIIHRQSGVVAVARPTGKISCFPPPLVCIRTVSARADLVTIDPSGVCILRIDPLALGRHSDEIRIVLRAAFRRGVRLREAELGAIARA